jgi:hypothetical protein
VVRGDLYAAVQEDPEWRVVDLPRPDAKIISSVLRCRPVGWNAAAPLAGATPNRSRFRTRMPSPINPNPFLPVSTRPAGAENAPVLSPGAATSSCFRTSFVFVVCRPEQVSLGHGKMPPFRGERPLPPDEMSGASCPGHAVRAPTALEVGRAVSLPGPGREGDRLRAGIGVGRK